MFTVKNQYGKYVVMFEHKEQLIKLTEHNFKEDAEAMFLPLFNGKSKAAIKSAYKVFGTHLERINVFMSPIDSYSGCMIWKVKEFDLWAGTIDVEVVNICEKIIQITMHFRYGSDSSSATFLENHSESYEDIEETPGYLFEYLFISAIKQSNV